APVVPITRFAEKPMTPTDTDTVALLTREIRALLAFQGDLGLSGLDVPTQLFVSPPAQQPAESTAVVKSSSKRPKAPEPVLPEALQSIRNDIGDCTRCKLCKGRTHIVFGVGNPQARLMFIGEGPGRDEDLQGEPFVGAAGQLLDKMIQAMGLFRRDVY